MMDLRMNLVLDDGAVKLETIDIVPLPMTVLMRLVLLSKRRALWLL